MLPENPTEEEVYAVLQGLGNPWKLAEEYQPVKRYLIGPSLYLPYTWVLKFAVTIAAILAVAFTVFEWTFVNDSPVNLIAGIVTLIIQLLASALNGGIQAAFRVTLAFVIFKKTGVGASELPFKSKEWSPKDLPEVATSDKAKISRGETAFELLFLIIIAFVFFFRPEWVGVYLSDGGSSVQSIPLFNANQIQLYLPLIVLMLAFGLIIAIWKLIWGRWHKSLAVTNLIFNLISAAIVIFMSLDTQLLNENFFVKLHQIFGEGDFTAGDMQSVFVRLTLGVILLVTIVDSIPPFFKLNRKSK